jgi:TonB-linked SusC/RagA family outer membrane protein
VVFPSIVDVTRYDYQDQIFRQAAGTDNTLTVSGGSEKTRYYASINAYNNQGIINNTDFTRLSGRIRLDHQVNNWLSFSTGLTYANSKTNELPNGNVFFSPINSINITNNIFNLGALDASGNYQAVERLSRINPLDIINRIKNSQLTNRLLGNVEIKLTPIKDLVLTYTVGMDNANQLGRNYSPIYTYAVNPLYFNKGYVANNTATTLLINSDITAAYSKTFGKFSSNTVAGYNFQRSREQVTITEGRDLAPFVTTVNGATVVLPPRLSDVGSDVEGGFLQETFGYDNKAFLTLAGRVDASSRYPVDTRQNFYPKVGFSYIPSQEAYWDKLRDAIPAFKLRASWGQSGNLTGFGAFDRFNRFSTPSFNGVTAISANSSVADQNVKVEKNEELEFGADISLWKDFARVGVTYYKQTVNDLLLNVTTAPSQGGTSIKTNVGTLENKGLEITLGITAFKNSKANLEIFGTYSKNDNMVTKLPFGLTAISSPLGAPVFIMQGAPVGVFYGSFYARDASGNILNRSIKVNGVPTQLPQIERGAAQNVQTPLVYNGYRDANGQPVITGANSQAQRKIIGNPNPRNIWSAGLNFTYEKLTFSTLLDAVSGVEIFNADKRTRNNVGIGYISEQELKGEVPRGTVAALAGIEEFRIDDGSFVKLREMSLAYNFGKLFKGVSDVQLTVSGRNLISWDNYFGYDPETTSGGQSSVLRGTDFGNVPIPRSYNIALKANF